MAMKIFCDRCRQETPLFKKCSRISMALYNVANEDLCDSCICELNQMFKKFMKNKVGE